MRYNTFAWSVAIPVGIVLTSVAGHPLSRARAAQGSVATQEHARGVTYTEEQAIRGQLLFRRHCLFCHSTNRTNQKSEQEPLRGFRIGDRARNVMGLGGGPLVRKFPSVYHLYVRVRDNMPAWDIESVSPAQKLDIVAFLLKENGIPPGREELPLDVEAMKEMRFTEPKAWAPEPGFKTIFNGKDFTNIKFLFGYNCSAPPGRAKTDPTAFSILNGTILAHGRPHGYLYTEKRYLNFDLRFDYRIVPPPDFDLGDEFFAVGGGFLLFITRLEIWPEMIEIEGDNSALLRPSGIGMPITATYDQEAVLRANKGPGPWNSVEIISKDGQVEARLNGTVVSKVTKHPFKEPGHIGIQYQGGTWQYRRLRIQSE